LKKFEWAKYALLNADVSVSADTFRLNSFKGCLLNSQFDEEEPRCFIKMVATNLIAQNQIGGKKSIIQTIITSLLHF
jgi:hypothetical protein